jgi:hypothetical protein
LDGLLTQMLAALLEAELIDVDRISNDGTRQRTGAGRDSFKTAPTLAEHLETARAHVEAVKQQAADPALSAQRQKAIERAARQRVERLEKPLQK